MPLVDHKSCLSRSVAVGLELLSDTQELVVVHAPRQHRSMGAHRESASLVGCHLLALEFDALD